MREPRERQSRVPARRPTDTDDQASRFDAAGGWSFAFGLEREVTLAGRVMKRIPAGEAESKVLAQGARVAGACMRGRMAAYTRCGGWALAVAPAW